MRNHKSPKVDLEKKRTFYFYMGLTISFSFALLAFEWTTLETDSERIAFEGMNELLIVEEIDAHVIERKKVAPPKLPTNQFQIAPDPTPIPDPNPDPNPFDPVKGLPDIKGADIGFSDDPGDEDPLELMPAMVEILPFFIDCTNVVDRDQQNQCSQDKIIAHVSSNVEVPSIYRGMFTGTVYVGFMIDEFGQVQNVEIKRGIHKAVDKAVIKAVESIPQMEPGSQQGMPVRVLYNIPVKFVNK